MILGLSLELSEILYTKIKVSIFHFCTRVHDIQTSEKSFENYECRWKISLFEYEEVNVCLKWLRKSMVVFFRSKVIMRNVCVLHTFLVVWMIGVQFCCNSHDFSFASWYMHNCALSKFLPNRISRLRIATFVNSVNLTGKYKTTYLLTLSYLQKPNHS